MNPHGIMLSNLQTTVGTVDSSDYRRSDFSLIHIGVTALMGFLQSQIRAWSVGLINFISNRQVYERLVRESVSLSLSIYLYDVYLYECMC